VKKLRLTKDKEKERKKERKKEDDDEHPPPTIINSLNLSHLFSSSHPSPPPHPPARI
jgi:hypothetical protein